MNKLPRDYQKEYQRRLRLAKSRGLTRSQARGHARGTETPVAKLKALGAIKTTTDAVERKYRKVVKLVSSGMSLTQATKKAHVARGTVLRLDRDREALNKEATGRYGVRGYAELEIYTKDGKFFPAVPFDKETTSLVARYLNAVKKAKKGYDAAPLKKYRGQVVYDIAGNRYTLLANLNDIRAIDDQRTEGGTEGSEREFYRSLRHAS